MISHESQQRAIGLLAEISSGGAELADLLRQEVAAGNLDNPVVQGALAEALLQFTLGVTVLRSGAELGFEAPETIGLVPDSVLPDFNLEVPLGTPNN